MLKAPSWQIFLAVFVPLVLSINIPDFWISTTLAILAYGVLFGWFLVVGINLNEQLPDEEKKSDILFIINCFYLILFLSISSILEDGQESEIPIILLLLVVYFAFAFFHVVSFVSQSFLALQELKSRKPTHYSSQSVFLYFFIFIVGIWFIQPRINEYFEDK